MSQRDDMNRLFDDVISMITVERDRRREDVKEIRHHLQAIDRRLAEGDDRSFTFETALLRSLQGLKDSINAQFDSLTARVEALERKAS